MILIIISIVVFTLFIKTIDNSKIQLNNENLRAISYVKVTEEDSKIENTDYVKFSAFFTRDLDGDVNAEKLLYPIVSTFIGVVEINIKKFKNILKIDEAGAQVKHLAKTIAGSTYLVFCNITVI